MTPGDLKREKRDYLLGGLRTKLGPAVLQALEDPAVTEVMLNPDGVLWEERRGEMNRIGAMDTAGAEAVLRSVANLLETVITPEQPILEGELPLDGSRFEGLLHPVVPAAAFTIRKRASLIFTLADYEREGLLTPEQRLKLERAITAQDNILVVGGTGTGKTTFANALIEGMTRLCPGDRLVIIEDTAEIQCAAENSLLLHTTPTVGMLRLLRATLRLRPDRILVGEVRGAEALALLKAWNTGHPGGIATVHADSA